MLTEVLCVSREPDERSRRPVAPGQAGAPRGVRAQQRGQRVQGQAEEGQGAEEQSRAIHHSNRGGRVWLYLHLTGALRENQSDQNQ